MTDSTAEEPISDPQPLASTHECESFDCGAADLNVWLKRFAASNQRAEYTRTFVACRADRVVGYYALAAGSVEPEQAPRRVTTGLPGKLPVPVVLLARLAVDESEQGAGLGAALLRDALLRAATAAKIVGARALLVDAQDEPARQFYERFDFEPSPVDPLQMFLLMKDLRRALE